MSTFTAYDELSTLLDLMSHQWEELSSTKKKSQLLGQKSRFYSLLNGWSKRTSVADQQQALGHPNNKRIALNSLGVALWAGEQALKYPKHTAWNTDQMSKAIITNLFYNDYLEFEDQVDVVLDLHKMHPQKELVEYIAGGLPSWAFTHPKMRSKVVDFYVRSFSFATAKNLDIISEALENTKSKDFQQIADEVQQQCAPHVQNILKLHKLNNMLHDGDNTWKSQKQLLDQLGENIVTANDNFSYFAEHGFSKNPKLMVQWLEYAVEHWSEQGFKRLKSLCPWALRNTLCGKDNPTSVWVDIAQLSGSAELFNESLSRFILETPTMTATEMRTAAQHLNAIIGNPTVAPIVNNLVLKQIDVSHFFASCEQSSADWSDDEPFVDKKLTQRMTSVAAKNLVQKLQMLHPSFSNTLRVLIYTVGGENPDHAVDVAKCSKTKFSMDADFSRPWARWETLSQKSRLNKAVTSLGVQSTRKPKRKM